MWNLTINGTDLYHILNWFFIYSFLGWVWETFYVSTKHGEFVNRGFVSGPFCTIYG
ncbi:MAG: putative ABC transporter permease, partial [Blautia caecimuris]